MRTLASMGHSLSLKWYKHKLIDCQDHMLLSCPWKLLIYMFLKQIHVYKSWNRTIHLIGYKSRHNAIWTNQSTCQYTLPLHIKCPPNRCTPHHGGVCGVCPGLRQALWEEPLTMGKPNFKKLIVINRLNLLSSQKVRIALWSPGGDTLCSSTARLYGEGRSTLKNKAWYEHTSTQKRYNSLFNFQ